MDASLALTALLLGLAGGPHCLVMCGAVCAGFSASASKASTQPLRFHRTAALAGKVAPFPASAAAAVQVPLSMLPPESVPAQMSRHSQSAGLTLFLLGRLLSYTLLGLVAAASMQAVGWLSVQSASLRPVWTFVHVGAAVMGGVLLLQARQPPWLEGAGRWLWSRVTGRWSPGTSAGTAAPLLIGLGWVFLPCGLLYSALLVAALSPSVWQGAVVMALFALGSGLSLWIGPWLWRRLGLQVGSPWAIRLAGAVLLASSVWALWLALVHDRAPWCVTPG